MEECPFCSLSSSRLVSQDALTMTVRDGFPVSPGHTLVITRRHVATIFEATPEEQLALMNALLVAKKDLDAELSPNGYNWGANQGIAAGQTVMHLHLHLIPRFRGDVKDPRGGIRHCIPEKGLYDPRKKSL